VQPTETLRVIHLADDRAILDVVEYAGSPSNVTVPLRAVASDAIRLGSRALVLSHNHPSGNAAPSSADIRVTRLLETTFSAIGIRLHDHLVIGEGGVTSFRAEGLL